MELQEAKQEVQALLNKTWKVKGVTYNLSQSGWSFAGFDRSVRRLGVCFGREKQIGLSNKMTELRTKEEVVNTIIHEIAHAIDREIRGTSNHDWHWKSVAREIGHSANRTSKVDSEVMRETYTWLAICPNHNVIGGWLKKPTRGGFRCKKCKSTIDIIEKNQYEFAEIFGSVKK